PIVDRLLAARASVFANANGTAPNWLPVTTWPPPLVSLTTASVNPAKPIPVTVARPLPDVRKAFAMPPPPLRYGQSDALKPYTLVFWLAPATSAPADVW